MNESLYLLLKVYILEVYKAEKLHDRQTDNGGKQSGIPVDQIGADQGADEQMGESLECLGLDARDSHQRKNDRD